jgi:hypothetical protein
MVHFAAIYSRNDDDRLYPTGRSTCPTPNSTKSASRSGQNRGRYRSRGRPSTLLPGCDAFATPVKSPENRLSFYLFTLNGPLSHRRAASERLKGRAR